MTATAAKMPMVSTPQAQFGVQKINEVLYIFQDTCPDGVALVEPSQRLFYDSNRNTDLAGIGGRCSHNINPFSMRSRIPKNQWEAFSQIIADPLVQLFLPVPAQIKGFSDNEIYLVDSSFNTNSFLVLKALERLCSPVHSMVDHWHKHPIERLQRAINLTNIHPVTLLMGAQDIDLQQLKRTLNLVNNVENRRPLILSARGEMFRFLSGRPNVKVVHTQLKADYMMSMLTTLPLESIGARVLGHYAVFRNLSTIGG